MISIASAGLGFLLMIGLMFLGLHVATVMFGVAILGAWLYLGDPIINAFGNQLWGSMEDTVLLSIPLYILVGEILVRGGATDRMYKSLADWLTPLPAGCCTRISVLPLCFQLYQAHPWRLPRPFPPWLCLLSRAELRPAHGAGTIAAGASLGNLIPPGIASSSSGR